MNSEDSKWCCWTNGHIVLTIPAIFGLTDDAYLNVIMLNYFCEIFDMKADEVSVELIGNGTTDKEEYE